MTPSKTLDVVKVGRRDDRFGYGERRGRPIRPGLSHHPQGKQAGGTRPPLVFKAKWRTRVLRSGTPALLPGARMTVRPDYAIITRHITARSSGTPMATGSKPSAITRFDQ